MRRSISLLLCTALVLTGCLAPKASDPARSGSLRVAVVGASGLDHQLTRAFNTQYPGVTVEPVTLPEGSFADILEAIRSGRTRVDVIVAPGNPYLFEQGVVAPLSGLVRQHQIELASYGPALEAGAYKGELYGLPISKSPMVLIYNQEALAEAGITPPTDPWSWEQFAAAVRTLAMQAAAKGQEQPYGAAIPPWVLFDLLLAAGQGPAADDLTDLQTALEHVQQLMVTEKILADFALGDNESAYFQAFGRGEFPLLISYWGVSFGHARPTFAWSTAPLPGSAPGGAVPGVVTLAMMTANAQNPEAAASFVRVASSQLAAQAIGSLPGSPIPGFISELTQRQWQAHSGVRGGGAFMLTQPFIPAHAYPGELIPLLLQQVDLLLAGEKAVPDAMRDFQQARAPFLSKK